MELIRKPTRQEEGLIKFLITKAFKNINIGQELLVRSMNDGNMGGLYLYPFGIIDKKRFLGELVSECQFIDEDGVKVIASLNVDQDGQIFEVDIWKTDFSPLIKIPEPESWC
ncbi:DUF6984 family protein [Pedobacter glucosidilyticus]|uniref:DUF6984 family protein n=1 Tax=Pedobacter glucosidilyticus TaxID=1122941 RepID=UPI0026F018C4|nr:hypothetical protein [Pedobacter glucosidilyticus]